VDISLTFGCKEPMSGTHLKLEGMGAFDAAVHCASVAAAERQQKIKKSYSTGNLGATPGMPADSMGRSASINNMPAAGSPTALAAPATPPPAAGASAAAPAAQDRRQRFPAQQPGAPAGQQRSRSFSAFSSSGPRSTGAEQPAAFRNILSMLNGSTQAAAGAGGAGQQQQPNQQAASPRSGLPPTGTVRFVEPPAAVTAEPSAAAGLRPARRSDRLSLRNISTLKDVPEADETVAVGSLSGKFKLSFKAFSRKVARSLSFTSKDGKPSSAASAGSGSSFTGSIASMEELPGSSSSSPAAGSAGAHESFSITSNSSNSQYGRASPLPPATPPSVYSC
jgi:hypothetical protein